jgi:hypothetical protein
MAREIEVPEYVAMVRRILRALGRRARAGADPEDLALMVALRDDLEEAISGAVLCNRELGRSWSEIAGPLGLTKQAMHQRYGDKQ